MSELEKLCKLVRVRALTEGENHTELPYLSIYLSAEKEIDMPRTENLYVYAVLDGDLAEQRNMSVSLFRQKFKSAVGMGPLQGQKRLRLTEARRLMLDESRNVMEASLEVGYESVSQFTRDYRKLFVNGKISGGIGVGGGTEEQDCVIAEHVVSVFGEMTACT